MVVIIIIDKEKELDRFTLKAKEIHVTFIPQCCTCKFNKNYSTCEKFNINPNEYIRNKKYYEHFTKSG